MDLPLPSLLYQDPGTMQNSSFLSVTVMKDYVRACSPLNISYSK